MVPYSILVFQSELSENTATFIEEHLRQGTKVFFFTYDPTDELMENDFFQHAEANQLLTIHETFYHESLPNDFQYVNGMVPEEILDVLAKQTPAFNVTQFQVEHALLESNIMVSAGAGTGKTTVMVSRILYLKHQQPNLPFSRIAFITFTNSAANNMRNKLLEKLNIYFQYTKDMKYLNWIQELKNMTIGTIHSFAQKILDHNKGKMFDSPDLILTSFIHRRRKLIEEVIDEYHLKFPKEYSRFKYIELYRIINTVELMIDQIENHSISVEKLLKMDYGTADDGSEHLYEYVVKETYKRLNAYKKQNHLLDVNDLIINMDRIVESEETFNIPYDFVFIDEFQDTDRVQTRFFGHVSNTYNIHLFVVGDVKQSIYRFRGADYTAFTQLKNLTSIDYEYFLQHNYRTSDSLLDYFNDMFEVWPQHVATFKFHEKDKLLSGLKDNPGSSDSFILKRFETKIGRVKFLEELENTDTGVLLRTNKEVNELAQLCEEHNIFFSAEQDGDFYRSIAVREFYMLIKRFTHPQNWKNRYMLHLSSYGERTLKVNDILEQFSPERSSQSIFSGLDGYYEKYTEAFFNKPVFAVIDEIISEVDPATTYANRYITNKSDKVMAKKQAEILRQEYQMNLDQLIYLLKNEMKHTIPSLSKLERLLRMKMQTDNTVSTLYKRDIDIDRMKIMTVHKAKGLEFDQVFLPITDQSFFATPTTDVLIDGDKIGYRMTIGKGKHYQNDIYKSLKKHETKENIGEETRLLYVALTRAKKRVYVDAPGRTNSHLVRNWGDLIAKSVPEKAVTF